MSQEDRIIELETKLVYQEDTLQTLNDIVVEQQQRVLILEEGFKALVTRISALDSSNDSTVEEIPPHY
jgi:SlyX protein|tara:strand:- start:149 stop:352 length:204 start_codon:yes stop_codon:yes gene_type:complete